MRFPPLSTFSWPLLAVALASPGILGSLRAESAATDPVGFISVKVEAGSPASPKLSLVSPTLLQPVAWQGAIATISGTTITVSGTPWTAGQFGTNGQYFVEVASGTSAGAWTDIQSATENTLTTLDDLSAFASGATSIRIRRHTKLSDFLGATNTAGLKGGSSVGQADEVMVYDGSTPTIYWYYDGSQGGTAGWLDSNAQPAANAVVAPHQGVIIRRKDTGEVNFTSTGAVKTGNTFFPIAPGMNVLGTVSAKGLTLATSGLYTGNASTGVKGGTSVGASDEITIFSATGPAVYWYYDGSQGGTAGWLDSNAQPASTAAIPPGSAILLRRKAPGVPFNWSVPSPSSF